MKLSIAVATNRSTFWARFCESLVKNDVEFEVIFVGPVNGGVRDLPVPARFIDVQDKEVGAARCWEIGARAASGELLGFAADDCVFTPGFLDAVVRSASEAHNEFDMFTPLYIDNGRESLQHQRMWGSPQMPLLPVGGFSFTSAHHKMGGIDRRFRGVFWDADLYMSHYELGGRTSFLDGHSVHEMNTVHGACDKYARHDIEVMHELWPVPLTAEMKRASPRAPWEDYVQ